MRFSADRQDDAVNAPPAERVTDADLRPWLTEQNVCLHLRGLDAVDHVTIPLYRPPEGLVHASWTIFGGRYSVAAKPQRRETVSIAEAFAASTEMVERRVENAGRIGGCQ